MELHEVMRELEALGTARKKKIYLQQGAREPLFGVATGAMKPLLKKTGLCQPLAESLYATGNYDAMYFAGVIAEPKRMTGADFDRWMKGAYFYMISDYIVAVTLAETDIAQEVADRWIASGDELYVSAGYSCYAWLLGNHKDGEFDREKLFAMLDTVEHSIHTSPNRAKYAMNNFIAAVGVSYLPLHERALTAAKAIGAVEVYRNGTKLSVPVASEEIEKMISKGRIGFKRRYVRC